MLLEITPEIAGYVVKDYLLPLFQQGDKKQLQKKSKHRQQLESTTQEGSGEKLPLASARSYAPNIESLSPERPTVFQELKLSA